MKKIAVFSGEVVFAHLHTSRGTALLCHRHLIHYRAPRSHLHIKSKKETGHTVWFLFFWGKVDTNHRSDATTDLQSAPFGLSGIPPYSINFIMSRRLNLANRRDKAGERSRTINLLITNQLLYR